MGVTATKIHNSYKPCRSPIEIKRLDKTAFSIAFTKNLFNLECLELALSGLGYGEGWDLYKPKDKQTKMYVVYYVILQDNNSNYLTSNDASDVDELLTSIATKIVKEVYLEELNLWDYMIEISDLVKPRQYNFDDGANISARTKSALYSVGFDTVQKLMRKKREEICKIPNMTTEEVYKLEKSMASRGFFLLTVVPKFA